MGFRLWSSFPEAEKQTKLEVAKTEQFGILDRPSCRNKQIKTNKQINKQKEEEKQQQSLKF